MSANAEIIAELRRVLNERDEARKQLDLTKRELGRWVDRETKAVRERDEARADDANAYRRGAEAMREASALLVSNEKRLWLRSELIADLRALPIPEEP
jgi:hypothetical protein